MDLAFDQQIESLLGIAKPTDDVPPVLMSLAELLVIFNPQWLWLADETGQVVSHHVIDDAALPADWSTTAGPRIAQARADRLPMSVMAADPGVDLVVCPADCAYGLGARLLGVDPDGPRWREWAPRVELLAAMVCRAMADHVHRQRAERRCRQLLAERDTLKASYSQIMSAALEEREQHLADQKKYTQQLEEQVAARSAELRHALDVAERANETKSQFLANMSHEIRTPMTAILGYTDLMIEESFGRTKALNWLSIIKRNGQHLLTLINDILDVSKIEAGKMQVENIAASPRDVVREVAQLMTPRAKDQNLALDVRIEPDVPQAIVTDPTRLRQILVNLVGNAIKFTKQGRITLKVYQGADDHDPRLCVDVIDTGIGISPEKLTNLFRPFAQADASTTRRFGGTGLGLVISRRLCELLGGSLVAASEPGRGSTFTASVGMGAWRELDQAPRDIHDKPTQTQDRPSCPLPDVKLADLPVLLADDGADNRMLVQLMLRSTRMRVTTCVNGLEAYTLAIKSMREGEPFAVVLMDMQMPELDGYQATRKLRDEGYDGPIIALTANAMSSDRQRCLDAGCSDYVAKPIDAATLIQTIQQQVLTYQSLHAQLHDSAVADQAAAAHGQLSPLMNDATLSGEQMQAMMDDFLKSLGACVTRIGRSLEQGDASNLAAITHELRDRADQLGYPAITRTASLIEQQLCQGADLESCRTLVDELLELCGKAIDR